LEIGGTLGGSVSLEKSLKVANGMLAANGLADAIHLEEGSGISRGNHFTARGLAQVLTLFAPHATLLRSGDGTLFKTGTFSGVRTLAGYADTAKHGRVRFVISLRSNDGGLCPVTPENVVSKRRNACAWLRTQLLTQRDKITSHLPTHGRSSRTCTRAMMPCLKA
jgi:D-alanyl-D-alanine carboxypeptidase